jgi:hypothetical protein
VEVEKMKVLWHSKGSTTLEEQATWTLDNNSARI